MTNPNPVLVSPQVRTSGVGRGWRFVHPDLDSGSEAPGMGVNLRGGAAMTDGAALVRQSLLLLLSTVPGERVMRPEYGCWLSRLLFAPNDDTTAGLAIHYVRQAVERFEPRAVIVKLDASFDLLQASVLRLDLQYRVPGLGVLSDLQLEFDLAGGG